MNDVEWRGTPNIEQVDPFTTRELTALLSAAERLEPDFATMLRVCATSTSRTR